MTQVTLKGAPTALGGKFPQIGDRIANFSLTDNELKDLTLDDFAEEFLILNIFVSLDTPVCAESIKHFNKAAADLPDCKILCISKDLPFAFGRFCTANNTNVVKTLSAFRSKDFAFNYGVDILDGPLRGLLARSVIVVDNNREVIYAELVPEITQEPNYEKCLSVIANYNLD